ncbi:MAG: nickel-dependent hydrogenase large subunit [Candidatus Dormiibacterota bacterium]
MTDADRTIKVAELGRVEGEGALHVRIKGGQVKDVRLELYEPPRFFESLLRGRSYLEPVDITARICGICPIAYQMSAGVAIEDACGVTVGGPIHDLRRLIYCGEWIESHALHVYLLHAPDFLGYDSAIAMARDHADVVKAGLQLKKAGNQIVEVVGGRPVHPVNPRVGGFHRAPSRAELEVLVAPLEKAYETARSTVRWTATFDFPEFEPDWELVSLSHARDYPMLGDRIVSTRGLDIPVRDFAVEFTEQQSGHSTALLSRHRGKPYLVGPLARFALNFDKLSADVRAEATLAGVDAGCRNPFRSIIVRALETMEACAIALNVIRGYSEPQSGYVDVQPRAGTGYGASEAPRGLLYHSYELDAAGLITQAVIVPPTAQNQLAIEDDLRGVVGANLHLENDRLQALSEQTIRNYDPCISCATHFLRVEVEEQ